MELLLSPTVSFFHHPIFLHLFIISIAFSHLLPHLQTTYFLSFPALVSLSHPSLTYDLCPLRPTFYPFSLHHPSVFTSFLLSTLWITLPFSPMSLQLDLYSFLFCSQAP